MVIRPQDTKNATATVLLGIKMAEYLGDVSIFGKPQPNKESKRLHGVLVFDNGKSINIGGNAVKLSVDTSKNTATLFHHLDTQEQKLLIEALLVCSTQETIEEIAKVVNSLREVL
jgi:hypothetical protein